MKIARIIGYTLRLILASVFVASAAMALYPVEPLEYHFYEFYSQNWLITPLAVRLIIGLHFATAALLIIPGKLSAFTKILSFGIVLFNLSDLLLFQFKTDTIILSSFSDPIDLTFTTGLAIWGSLFLLLVLLITNEKEQKAKFKWLKIPIALLSLVLPFILNPVYPQDFQDNSDQLSEVFFDNPEIAPALLPENDTRILAFFSPSCPHCENAAKKIYVSQKMTNFPKTEVWFLGKEEHAKTFFARTNTNFQYRLVEPELFLKTSGATFPSFVLLENGSITRRWDGRTFNFGVMHQLSRAK